MCMHPTECCPIYCFITVFGKGKRVGLTAMKNVSFTSLRYDARNDVLPCWIGPTNCQPKWLRTRSAEIRHEEKYFDCWSCGVGRWTVDETMWKPSPNCRSRFFENRTAETEFSVFEFWGQFSSVPFLENRYPTFSSGSAHPEDVHITSFDSIYHFNGKGIHFKIGILPVCVLSTVNSIRVYLEVDIDDLVMCPVWWTCRLTVTTWCQDEMARYGSRALDWMTWCVLCFVFICLSVCLFVCLSVFLSAH